MEFSQAKVATKFYNACWVAQRANRLFGIFFVCWALTLTGCTTLPTQTKESQTLWSSPVKVTQISLPGNFFTVHSIGDYVWASKSSMINPKTIRIDPKANKVAEFSRPRSDGSDDFLVDENSIWYTDGEALQRVEKATNQLVATIEDAGVPFALGDGAVWTYNRKTLIVSGIDANTNQRLTQVSVPGRPYHAGSFAYGAGSIWQLTYSGDVTIWQDRNLYGDALHCIIRRINPYTKKVITEIPVGLFTNIVDPYVSPDRIHYIAGDIWVLGSSGETSSLLPSQLTNHSAPFIKRINVETNSLAASILLKGGQPLKGGQLTTPGITTGCPTYRTQITPVLAGGALWVSVHCGKAQSELLKIDLKTNQIVGVLPLLDRGIFNRGGFWGPGFLVVHPHLTVTGESLWGISGSTAIRVDF